jgi:hypothetical protein
MDRAGIRRGAFIDFVHPAVAHSLVHAHVLIN